MYKNHIYFLCGVFQISSEIEDFQAQGVQLEAEREQILQRLEEKQGSATKAANEYDEKHKGVMKILDQLRAGEKLINHKLRCLFVVLHHRLVQVNKTWT